MVSYEIIADHLTALSSNRCCHCWHHYYVFESCFCVDVLIVRLARRTSGVEGIALSPASCLGRHFATIHSSLVVRVNFLFFYDPAWAPLPTVCRSLIRLHKINRQRLPCHPRIAPEYLRCRAARLRWKHSNLANSPRRGYGSVSGSSPALHGVVLQ